MATNKFTKADIGRRVVYTARNGKTRNAALRDVIEGVNQVDIEIDGLMRDRYYVPDDTVEFDPLDIEERKVE